MLNPFTILYVEDEDGLRTNIAKSLRLRCKEVYEAANAEEAFTLYKTYSPNLILTDIQMPKVDGIELIKRIREIDKSVPIIVMSGNSDRVKETEDLGVLKYMIKPLSRKSLKEIIDLGFEQVVK